MARIKEWQGGSGIWYAADTTDLKNNSGAWWYIPRLLNISLTDYVNILVKDYKVDFITFNNDFLDFGWKNYTDCHKYVLNFNKMLKNMGKYN